MEYFFIKDLISDNISGEWGIDPVSDKRVKVIRTTNFTNKGEINLSNVVEREISDAKVRQKQLKFGDIIIEKSGGSPSQPVGRVVFFDNADGDTYLCNNFTSILRPSAKVFPKYLFYNMHYLHKQNRTLNYQNKTTGIINLQLDRYIKSEKLPLPPIEDQKRIVEILDRADALRQKRKQAIDLLDDYLKSVFLEMFGDPQINPKRFPLVELREFYIDPKNGTKCGPFGSALKKEEFVDYGVPVWNMDNISVSGQMVMPFRMWITPEKYRSLEAYSVINGDVIISRAGTVGKMCVARIPDDKSIISTNLIRVRFGNKLLPLYFVSLMTYCKGRAGRLKTGSDGAFTHMNTGVLDTLTFPYPPLHIQNNFATIVQKTESLKEKMLVQSEELETQFQSLMQKAFKGEL